MSYFVYIIQSEKDGSYYKGFSEHPLFRLQQHNQAESQFTSSGIPWKLVYVESFEVKKDALIREKNLKKYSRERIEHLIKSPKNQLHRFNQGLSG